MLCNDYLCCNSVHTLNAHMHTYTGTHTCPKGYTLLPRQKCFITTKNYFVCKYSLVHIDGPIMASAHTYIIHAPHIWSIEAITSSATNNLQTQQQQLLVLYH